MIKIKLQRLVAASLLLLSPLLLTLKAPAAQYVFDENFDDDYLANRNVPNGIDPTRSSPFASINACRPERSGKLMITTIDISSYQCPPPERTSCCGPAMGFEDGGGTFVTFHYSITGTISTGSFVSFQVVAYGDDSGKFFKFVSTDGVNFTPIGTNQCPMGNYQFPLPTGTSEVFFKLQIGADAGLFDGIIVDNFHAVLFDVPQTPASIQEGGGSFCDFAAPPFCPPVPTMTQWGLIVLVVLLVFSTWVVLRRRKVIDVR